MKMMYYSTLLMPSFDASEEERYNVITQRYATQRVSYQDVLELEISVDNSLFMYAIQRCSDLFQPKADFADDGSIFRPPRNTVGVVKNEAL